MKHYRINSEGKLVQVKHQGNAHLSAESLAEAKTKVFKFARRALNEPPQVRLRAGAVQVAYWSMDCVQVMAGYGTRPDLCLSGEPWMQDVTEGSSSFSYYVNLSLATQSA
jgi:hypothetical protein